MGPDDNLKVGEQIDDARIDAFFQQDAASAMTAAKAHAAEAGIAHGDFLPALASVNFQLGDGWRNKFPAAWQKIKDGDYTGAAIDVALNGNGTGPSIWKAQTPDRVQDFQSALWALAGKRR